MARQTVKQQRMSAKDEEHQLNQNVYRHLFKPMAQSHWGQVVGIAVGSGRVAAGGSALHEVSHSVMKSKPKPSTPCRFSSRLVRAAGRSRIWFLMALGTATVVGCGRSIERLERNNDVKGLVAKLRHKDSSVRQSAAYALGKVAHRLGDETALTSAVGPLTTALQDRDKYVRSASARGLGDVGVSINKESALKSVFPALADASADRDNDVRVAVLTSVSNVVRDRKDATISKAAIPILTRALSDPAADVRREAASALGDIADVFAGGMQREHMALVPTVSPLVVAAQDADVSVREAAVMALGTVGRCVYYHKKALVPVGRGLLKALGDSSGEVRRAAAVDAESIWSHVDEADVLRAAVGPLVHILIDTEPDVVRCACAMLEHVAWNVKDPSALQPAIASLIKVQGSLPDGEPNMALAVVAARTRQKAAVDAVLPTLRVMLEDPNEGRAGLAAALLDTIRGGSSRAALRQAFREVDSRSPMALDQLLSLANKERIEYWYNQSRKAWREGDAP